LTELILLERKHWEDLENGWICFRFLQKHLFFV
jgi:hypothetical protein